jgi:biopolymer transport protein ExbB
MIRSAAPAPAPRVRVAAKTSTPAAARAEPAGSIGRGSVLRLFAQANPMLWPLVLCSVVTMGFALDRAFALRKGRVVPRDFVDRFMDRLSGGKLDRDRAMELCRSNESPVARLFGHAVRYWGQPASEIRQALDHDAAAELLDLRKNVRVLNATATLAPLLGLLGTVVGMIEAFEAIGSGQAAGAAKSEALAHGISLALMPTGFGLAVAVVSVAFYYYFLGRIDVLARALDDQASEVIDLIAAESSRSPRGPLGGSADLPRMAESRPLGRVDTL